MATTTYQKNYLESLPKELRLEIWKWVLTDPSVPNLVVNIGRDKTQSRRATTWAQPRGQCDGAGTGHVMYVGRYMRQKPGVPRISFWLQPKRNSPVAVALLRTNRQIYEEALPLLYRSVRFALADYQGIFTLFLGSLSPYPRSLIRHIKLHIKYQEPDSSLLRSARLPLFHWAMTCAQVAKLDGQLKTVELEGIWFKTWSVDERTKHSVLYPLCKIKTKKVFGANNESGAELLLVEAERELKEKIALRKMEAKRQAAIEAAKPELEKQDTGNVTEADVHDGLQQRQSITGHDWRRASWILLDEFTILEESTINRDLGTIPGIDVFEKQLSEHTLPVHDGRESAADDTMTLIEDWDMVSRDSASVSKSPPPGYMSRRSSASWTDAASTIAEAQEISAYKVES